MLTWEWLDEGRNIALNAHRLTDPALAWWMKVDTPYALAAAGQPETVAGGGVYAYAGLDLLRPGNYSVTMGFAGRTQDDAQQALAQIMQAAERTRWIRRNGWELPVLRPLALAPTYRPTMLGGSVQLTFQPALAYWLGPTATAGLVSGSNAVNVQGQATVGVRLELLASTAVVSPGVTLPGGTTALDLTVQPGAAIVLDARPGGWLATVNGVDQRLLVRGLLPELPRGAQTVTLPPGLSGTLTYRPGYLVPSGVVTQPDDPAEAGLYYEQIDWGSS